MGDDWTGKFDFLKPLCEIVYLPRTPDISTSQLKVELDRLRSVQTLLDRIRSDDLKDLIGVLDKIVHLK
jgi:hypothetical protein